MIVISLLPSDLIVSFERIRHLLCPRTLHGLYMKVAYIM